MLQKEKLPHGLFSKDLKPTLYTISVFREFFMLGGKPTDKKIPLWMKKELAKRFGWDHENSGSWVIRWGLNESLRNAPHTGYYHDVMKTACEIAWLEYTKCAI